MGSSSNLYLKKKNFPPTLNTPIPWSQICGFILTFTSTNTILKSHQAGKVTTSPCHSSSSNRRRKQHNRRQQRQAAASSSSSKQQQQEQQHQQARKQASTHARILHQSPIAMYILYTQYICIYIYLFMYIYHNILKYTLDGSTQIQHFCANKASGGGCSKWDASMMINSKGLAGCGSPFRKGKLFSTAMALYQLFQCGYCKWGYHTRLTTSADLGP